MGEYDYKRSFKTSQRLEYGIYQFLDHFFGRKRMFKLFESRRRKFYKKLQETLKQSGEGRMVPIERRKGLTMKEFKDYYMRKGIPVVIVVMAKDVAWEKNWSSE